MSIKVFAKFGFIKILCPALNFSLFFFPRIRNEKYFNKTLELLASQILTKALSYKLFHALFTSVCKFGKRSIKRNNFFSFNLYKK